MTASELYYDSVEPGPSHSTALAADPYYLSSDGAEAELVAPNVQSALELSPYSIPAGFTLAGGFVFFHAAVPSSTMPIGVYAARGQSLSEVAVSSAVQAPLVLPGGFTAVGGLVYFTSVDADGSIGLWRSDGTAAGTTEVASGLQNGHDLSPNNLTALGDTLLFAATDATGTQRVWTSDGTSAGTQPLTDSSGAALIFPPFSSATIVVSGARALVFGAAAIWSTDGTSAGTTEIYAGAQNQVLSDPLAWNGGVAFVVGASGGYSLWTTDGTSAGTRKIADVATALAAGASLVALDRQYFGSGLLYDASDAGGGTGLWFSNVDGSAPVEIALGEQGSQSLAPANLTRVGNLVFFGGTDASGERGLWVTDGTSAGTSEILSGSQDGYNLWPYGFTPFAAYNDDILFTAGDSSGASGLWISNGTSAGAYELVSGVTPANLTALGDRMIFSSGSDLWSTDGTVAGTQKIGSGTTVQSNLGNFVGLGDRVVFSGWNGQEWQTDGTAAGTFALSTPQNGADKFRINAAPDDFNGDGTSDMLWSCFNYDYGWTMFQDQHVGSNFYGSPIGPDILCTGDFNGDGTTDILSQTALGLREWTMKNGAIVDRIDLGAANGWIPLAGDFNGDGTTDLLWTNSYASDAWLWIMNGGQHTASVDLGNISGWTPVKAGDFNGDGIDDIVWQNNTSGDVYEWLMGNGARSDSVYLGNLSGWTLAGTGDFNGDGVADMVWTNNASGDAWEWTMNSSGARYKLAAVGDYRGAGTSDMVWQGAAAGDLWLWTMNGGVHTANSYLGSLRGWTAT